MKRILPFFILLSSLYSQDKSLLQSAFESAASEFNVPADVLRGVAFGETRWEQLEWAPGDTASCMGLPREYGVMALRSDGWFGHSLEEAAGLINQSVEVLKKDPVQNIRGAAALLRSLYVKLPIPDGTQRESLESWQNAVAVYSGIPQQELAQQHALEIFERVSKGYNDFGIKMTPRYVNLAPLHQSMEKAWTEAKLNMSKLEKTAAQPDYPEASWVSAYPGNWYTDGLARDFVVIHDMEGYYLSVISMFKNDSIGVSSVHYCVNGLQDSPSDRPAGDITQMVEEQYWAWHARCWNRYSLGIEHEGFVSNPAWFTVEQYLASAKLTRYMCLKYNIPMDRNHIIGHNQWQNPDWVNWINTVYKLTYPNFDPTCNSHTDPGALWDWDFYMQMVKQDSTAPRVVSAPSAVPLQVFEPFSVTFDQRLDPDSVEHSMKIVPAVTGSISWSTDHRTMSFTPDYAWDFDSTYTVTFDSSAKNYVGIGLDADSNGVGGDAYSFQFKTVSIDTVRPTVTSAYPPNNAAGVSSSVEFQIQYSEPLVPGSIPNSIILTDAKGDTLPLSAATVTKLGTGSFVRLHPVTDLAADSAYKLTIDTLSQDYGGNPIASTMKIAFTTGSSVKLNGTVLDDLDAIGSWWQPSTSGSTFGVKTASFAIVTDKKVGGTGSGKLTYTFAAGSGGILREHDSATPSIGGGAYVGAWVYGDNSGNQLEYWFYYGTTYTAISVGQIKWTGWKLVGISTSLVPADTGRRFASFGIRQVTGARISGEVYFDELTLGSSITDAQIADAQLPRDFGLDQNYPNPFNPSTTITYRVAAPGRVKLTVYDLLGRIVDLPVDAVQPAGSYRVVWNAGSFPSGVYYLRMEADGFVGTRKLVLIK